MEVARMMVQSAKDEIGQVKADLDTSQAELRAVHGVKVENSRLKAQLNTIDAVKAENKRLNDALEAAIQKNAAPGAITGKTMEEQMNSTAPKEAMTITSVDDLVKMGIIKAVPPAPDGKTYSIKAGKVVLE